MFVLTEDNLLKLWALNHYPVDGNGWVLFGLRGCLPVNDEDHRFAQSHQVQVEAVDYTHPRCTLGQWKPGSGIALFPGSTVPHRKHVEASRPRGGAETNQLMTGYYADYRKGVHKAGTPTAHDAFRQAGKLPVQRTSDDVDFDADDRVEFEQPFDNLHAAWSQGVNHDSFASAGCQVIVGFPRCAKRENHDDTGPWKEFKENAYSIAQTSFPYALLTGREVERVSMGVTSTTLRYGSKGALVTAVQEALKKRGFYEGEIDDDFGFRTLRAVLNFQTAEFGPSADDGIVGKQTAAALGIPWGNGGASPVAAARAPAPVAAPRPPAPPGPLAPAPPAPGRVTLDGDHAVAPDGTRFAKRFRKGLFTSGKTSIADFVQRNHALFAGVPPSLLNVIAAVSQNEGKLEAINTWDDAFMTFGVFQWTAGGGELGALLDRVKREAPASFKKLFGDHGLDVGKVAAGPGITPTAPISLDGEALDTAAKKERLRTLDWAFRFWSAGHDDAVRTIEIKQAMDRVQIFYKSPQHKIGAKFVASYVSSEVGVALLLDQHVNRPGHVPKTLAQALAAITPSVADPAGWTDDDERELLHAYIELRAGTSMTDSDKRAQAIFEAAARDVVSSRRGSFVA